MQFLYLAVGYRDERVPDATKEETDAAQEHLRCSCGRWRDARHGMARLCARSREALHDVPDQPKGEPRGSKAIASTPQLIGNVLQERTASERRRTDVRGLGGSGEIENITRAPHASAFPQAERVLDSV